MTINRLCRDELGRILMLAASLLLAACASDGDGDGDGDDKPANDAEWQIGPIIDGKSESPGMPTSMVDSFDFPRCSNPISPDGPSVHAVTRPAGGPLTGTVSLTYEIKGNGVFAATEGHSPRLALFFQRKGDDWSGKGEKAAYRWYSRERLELAAGTYTITVPLDYPEWGPVYSSSEYNTPAMFGTAAQNASRVGFVFGGSVGAAHGVCLTSGSARFTIKAWKVG